MTSVLYNKQRKESIDLVLGPDDFKQILEDSDTDLIGFFDEMCESIIPSNWSSFLQNEARKKVVATVFSI
jgi:hypothetical protein